MKKEEFQKHEILLISFLYCFFTIMRNIPVQKKVYVFDTLYKQVKKLCFLNFQIFLESLNLSFKNRYLRKIYRPLTKHWRERGVNLWKGPFRQETTTQDHCKLKPNQQANKPYQVACLTDWSTPYSRIYTTNYIQCQWCRPSRHQERKKTQAIVILHVSGETIFRANLFGFHILEPCFCSKYVFSCTWSRFHPSTILTLAPQYIFNAGWGTIS